MAHQPSQKPKNCPFALIMYNSGQSIARTKVSSRRLGTIPSQNVWSTRPKFPGAGETVAF
jgi:hypothetical protein